MLDKNSLACFTGHRPVKSGFRFEPDEPETAILTALLDETIVRLCLQENIRGFLCGMARGFDLLAGSRVLLLRSQGILPKETALIAVMPFVHQTEEWREERWLTDHARILQQTQLNLTCTVNFVPSAYRDRNRFMVENSRCVVAYWNHKTGRSGTAMTVHMAQRLELPILNLYDQMQK